MAITISEETRSKFRDAHFTDSEIDEIRDNAKSGAVVALVASEIFVLDSIHMVRAGIAEIATEGSEIAVVGRALVKATDLKDAGLANTQIRQLAINAPTERDVDYVLGLARAAKESRISAEKEEGSKTDAQEKQEALTSALAIFCPQISTPSIAASQEKTGVLAVNT